MTQNSIIVSNGAGAAVRADFNAALQTLATNFSGATEPAVTVAYQFWYDTTLSRLKVRNGTNNGWLEPYEVFTAKNTITNVDPTVNDDSSAGYSSFSLWINNSGTGEIFRCISAAVGAAVWLKTTLTLDELGDIVTHDASEFALAGHDHADKVISRTTDLVLAYPSSYATMALVHAEIAKYSFKARARAIIRIDAGHTVAEQFIFSDGDYSFIQIEYAGRTSIRNASYKWTKYGATNEYYLELAAGGNPSISEPKIIRCQDAPYWGGYIKGTIGSLAVASWGYGATGAGFNSIFIRLADNSDPDTKETDYIQYENAVPVDMSGFVYQPQEEMFYQSYSGSAFDFRPFLGIFNANSPIIDFMVDGNKAVNTAANTIPLLAYCSKVAFTRGMGLWNAQNRNLLINSEMVATHCIFDSANIPLQLVNSTVWCDSSVINSYDASTYCIYAINSNGRFNSARLTSAAGSCVLASEASNLAFLAGKATVSSGNGDAFNASSLSRIAATGAAAVESGSGFGYKVLTGGFIDATSGSGSLSQTKNVVTLNGIIFQP